MKWDISGLSYYCMWHGSLSNVSSVITDVRTRYGKPVVIAETAYQFTTGNGWDNMATFDWTGHVNPNIRWTP